MIIQVLLIAGLLLCLFFAVTHRQQWRSLSRAASVVALTGIYLVLFPENAYAYLDVGAGSILLQALIAAVAGALVVIRAYWSKWKSRFTSSKNVAKQSTAEVAATENTSKRTSWDGI